MLVVGNRRTRAPGVRSLLRRRCWADDDGRAGRGVAESGGRTSPAQEQLQNAPLPTVAQRPSRRSRSQRELTLGHREAAIGNDRRRRRRAQPDEHPLP
jgi:hypothetical protein